MNKNNLLGKALRKIMSLALISAAPAYALTYNVVDTGQKTFYGNSQAINAPLKGTSFYGQDAQYTGNQPSYTDNGDGTVTDNVTGLVWQQSVDQNGDGKMNAADKMTYDRAVAGASKLKLGGHSDWRLPTIKEAYSLILFSGEDISGYKGSTAGSIKAFIDAKYFAFGYGDVAAGERLLEGQMATSSVYGATTRGEKTMFGVNFVDGRIKGYGLETSFTGGPKVFYVMYVRGNSNYGQNDFVDNKNGTVTDKATGLIWMQTDSGKGMNWEEALSYAENTNFGGHTDWRLPNAKELQSLIDYERAPATTQSPAIDSIFSTTKISNEKGEVDYPYFWSSTTHDSWHERRAGSAAVYLSFGRAMGNIRSGWTDIHGAGAQRSDPKTGDPAKYAKGFGPQGDAIRIYNYVRLVR